MNKPHKHQTHLRQQRRHHADPLLAQHRVEQRAHRVLDVLGRQDPVALRPVVHAVPRPGDALQRALVVLGLHKRSGRETYVKPGGTLLRGSM